MTPKTDAALVRLDRFNGAIVDLVGTGEIVAANFARVLECDLAAALARAEKAEKEVCDLRLLNHDIGLALHAASLKDTPASQLAMALHNAAILRHELGALRERVAAHFKPSPHRSLPCSAVILIRYLGMERVRCQHTCTKTLFMKSFPVSSL